MTDDERRRSEHARIYEEWHRAASMRDQAALIALYADDAILETPLVMAILPDKTEGVLRGHAEIRHFLDEGLRRRPNELVRWVRSGLWLSSGDTLVWEYPRETHQDQGDQIDILELMQITAGLIQHHRIFWGWFGVRHLIRNALGKSLKPKPA